MLSKVDKQKQTSDLNSSRHSLAAFIGRPATAPVSSTLSKWTKSNSPEAKPICGNVHGLGRSNFLTPTNSAQNPAPLLAPFVNRHEPLQGPLIAAGPSHPDRLSEKSSYSRGSELAGVQLAKPENMTPFLYRPLFGSPGRGVTQSEREMRYSLRRRSASDSHADKSHSKDQEGSERKKPRLPRAAIGENNSFDCGELGATQSTETFRFDSLRAVSYGQTQM